MSASTPVPAVVTAPQLVTISDTNSTIYASWPPVEHAVRYSLVIETGTNFVEHYDTAETSFTFEGLEPGTEYNIKVTALDQAGRSGDHTRSPQLTRKQSEGTGKGKGLSIGVVHRDDASQ